VASSKWSLALVAAVGSALSGCGQKTLVIVEISGAGVDAPSRIELTAALGARSAVVSLAERGGGTIALPTSTALEIGSGDGMLTVVARAFAGSDMLIANGTGNANVARGKTSTIPIDLERVTPLRDPVTLTVVLNGAGSVSGDGIACPDKCSVSVERGTMLSLLATPDASASFSSWGGCTGGSGATCDVTVDADKTVTATFVPKIQDPVTLTVILSGAGSAGGGGIACPGTCSMVVERGTALTIAATPDVSTNFTSWTGCTGGSGVSCDVTVDADKTVTATFAIKTFTLTVQRSLISTANGTVSSSPAGINCPGGTCTATFNYGESVKLTAAPSASYYLRAWTDDCAATTLDCTVTMTGNRSVTATFTPANLAFVSSKSYAIFSATPGAGINSESNANAECGAMASAAGIPGNYKAWISTSTKEAIDGSRWGGARGWVRRDGKPFVDTLASFGGGIVLYPPRLTESGTDLGGDVYTATGTFPGGRRAAGFMCGDWTSTAGNLIFGFADGGAVLSYYAGSSQCQGTNWHLICMQTDYNAAINYAPVAGRIIFMSKDPFNPATGVLGADTLCWNDARNNGLPNPGADAATSSYLAVLATNTASAKSRFASAATPIVRSDGVVVAANDAALFGVNATLQAALEVFADKSHDVSNNASVWSGAANPTVAGAGNNETCSNWASNAGAFNGVMGSATNSAINRWFNSIYSPQSCDTPYSPHVYCLQK
jgi:hypothetical protein